MSLFNTDYSSSTSSNNGDNDYEERDSLKLANYAIVSFTIDRIDSYGSNRYGQSAIVDVDDVTVQHGLAYDRFYNDEDDTVKVFGFGEWFQTNEDGTLAEEIQDDLLNKRISESYGGESYPYEYMDHTTEDDSSEFGLGNMTMWLNNTTKNRTFLKVVTSSGHDVIDDKDDDNEWLNENGLEIRDDLRGRRITLFYKKNTFTPDDQDEPVTYTDAVVLDAETGAGITIQNGDANSGGSSDDTESQDGGTVGGSSGDDEDLPDGVPESASEIISFMARTGETNPENVEQFMNGEVDDEDDYDLEAVIAEIEERM